MDVRDGKSVISRIAGRAAVVAGFAVATVAMLAAPALAHTEIELTPARAGAANATMKVTAEAENTKAGIKSVRMVLPPGITASQVTLAKGPTGWALQPTSDGFTVTGPTLKVKTDAEFTVTIAQVPADAKVLTFKTLVTYSNGDVDRWIGAAGDSNPAPFVSLAPAPSSTVASPSPSAVATGAAAAPSSPAVASSPAAPAGSSSVVGWVVAAIVVGLVVIGLVVWLMRRRGDRTTA
jgi:Domain of unkown function (DUF1775)